MELESLNIHKCSSYEKEKGYKGQVTFTGPLGKIQLNLGEELSSKILNVVSEQLTESSRLVAEELTANIIEQVNDEPKLLEESQE